MFRDDVMKAIMLAAGEGKRLRPLTYTKPKPLLKIANKPILQHNLEQLSGLVNEVIIVVGYKEEMIRKFFGSKFKSIKIRYVMQKKQLGTGDALLKTEKLAKGKFLVMYGDDLYHKEDLKKCIKHELCILSQKVKEYSRFGVLIVKNKKLKDIVEKPRKPVSKLANTGTYVLDDNIFGLIKKLKKSPRGELELTDAVKELAKEKDIYCEKVSKYWIPIGYPWILLSANKTKLDEEEKSVHKTATIEKNAILKGKIKVGKNTLIKHGVYIEGPCVIGDNCTIGPNCYIRAHTAIGNNCKIGNGVEIKNSIVMDNTNIGHLSYIGDSVIGEHCNFGAGTKVANLRHDNKTIKVNVNGNRIDSGERKLGVFMADYTKTGINTSIYPGVIMGPHSWTLPGSQINRDVKSHNLSKK